MAQVVNCPNCRTPLQLPPSVLENTNIRCAVCRTLFRVANDSGVGGSKPFHLRHALKNAVEYGKSLLLQPDNPRPPAVFNNPQPPAVHGKKRAVVCGVCYRRKKYELRGCINDVVLMKDLLTRKYNFPPQSILVLTGEEMEIL